MNFKEETTYLNIAREIQLNGSKKDDRTKVGTKAKFGATMNFDLFNRKLPIVTTRKIKPMDPIIEMLWFIAGDTDIEFLKNHNINIWDSWVKEDTKRYDANNRLIGGSIGTGAYGAQWRKWEDTRIVSLDDWRNKYSKCGYSFVCGLTETAVKSGSTQCVITRTIDQLAQMVDQIKNNPDSRRMIVSAWNPGKAEDMQLLPCHMTFQVYTQDMTAREIMHMLSYLSSSHDTEPNLKKVLLDRASDKLFDTLEDHELIDLVNKLHLPTKSLKLHLLQRSCDWLVGGAYNVLQYSALAHMLAQVTNTWASQLRWSVVDAHIYSNQFEQLNTQLTRTPLDGQAVLHINPKVRNIDDFTFIDFEVFGYKHLDHIKYPIAV